MKNPFRRRPRVAPAEEQAAADALRAALWNAKPGEAIAVPKLASAPWVSARPALDPDVQARIDAELEKHPAAMAEKGCFFGVPLSHFNREELMQIVSWVAGNARDHRRDS